VLDLNGAAQLFFNLQKLEASKNINEFTNKKNKKEPRRNNADNRIKLLFLQRMQLV